MPDPITYQVVKSSTLHSVAFDPEGSVLLVRFRDRQGQPIQGSHYEYQGVPEWVYQDLIDPDFNSSRGRFFDRVVKGGGFSYRKVEEEAK